MNKISILVIPSDNIGGVGFYRSIQPHVQLANQFKEEFDVTIQMEPNFRDLASFEKYNIIHFHKGLFRDMDGFRAALKYFKEKGIVTIMDIDDYWHLHTFHPQYANHQYFKLGDKIVENFKLCDYVTTTTSLFAKEVSKYNKNVKVIPNAIDPTDERFIINKKPSDKLRIGLIMGSAHEEDLKILNNITNGLSKDVLDKVQFVLCGFDLRGSIKNIDPKTQQVTERPLKPKESVWYRYELMLTNNYNIISNEYKQFLELFIADTNYPNEGNESYKRRWTKDIDHYYSHYNEVDVLLAPLSVNKFNEVKSQLKVVECAFSHTAIIASDFGPYTLDLKPMIEKGGIINPKGNALLVNEMKNHKEWKKYIEKLVKNPDMVKNLQDNLYNDIHEKYDLRNVTKDRAEFYKSVLKKD